MKIQAETEVILKLLKAAIDQESFKLGDVNISWEKVGKTLHFHRILNMAYCGIQKMEDKEQIPQAVYDKIKKAYDVSVAREAHQHFGLEEIRKEFEKNEIVFVPLKGSILKYMYPSPQMRSMSDLDILYKFEQRDKIKECLLGLGYTTNITDEIDEEGHVHDEYMRKPYMHIEMHRRLLRKPEKQKEYFDGIWDRLHLAEGKQFEYEMTLEDYYLFLLAHMAKHFLSSGTGLRSLTDFHVFINKKGKELDRTYVDEKLKEIELDRFESFLFEIDACVFGGKEWEDEQLFQTFQYMLSSGIYGTLSNGRKQSALEAKDVNKNSFLEKVTYITRMIFLKPTSMEMLYPWLKGRRYLLVPAWIYRLINRILFKKELGMQVLSNINVEKEEIDILQQVQERAGLRD